jgi:PST family polysaccharide transporter
MRILNVIVGFYFGAAAIGLMSVAARFNETIYGAVAAPMGSLWVIMLSKEKDSTSARSDLYLGLTQLAALICLPIFAGIALTSNDLVRAALNDDFIGVGPYLAVFASIGLLTPLFYFRNAVFTALRRLTLLLGLAVVDVVSLALAAMMAGQWSPLAVAATMIVPIIVTIVLITPIILREMNTNVWKLIEAILPAYFAVAIMAAAVLGVNEILPEDIRPYIALLVKAFIGASVYAGYLIMVHRKWVMTAINIARAKDDETDVVAADAVGSGVA